MSVVMALPRNTFALKERSAGRLRDQLQPGGLYVDVKCQANAKELRSRGLGVEALDLGPELHDRDPSNHRSSESTVSMIHWAAWHVL